MYQTRWRRDSADDYPGHQWESTLVHVEWSGRGQWLHGHFREGVVSMDKSICHRAASGWRMPGGSAWGDSLEVLPRGDVANKTDDGVPGFVGLVKLG